MQTVAKNKTNSREPQKNIIPFPGRKRDDRKKQRAGLTPLAVLWLGTVGAHCPIFVEVEIGEAGLLLEIRGADFVRLTWPVLAAT